MLELIPRPYWSCPMFQVSYMIVVLRMYKRTEKSCRYKDRRLRCHTVLVAREDRD